MRRRAVAYCRVSTDKEDQLNSLEMQHNFFIQHAEKNELELIDIYADEGITGTKKKNRKEFLRMLEDAQKDKFDILFVKDISRFARNTVDSLESIRKLKDCNVKIVFINNEGILESGSELMFTIMSAMAQEESVNMSKRVKFGKAQNALKGKVPNFVYGYDKISGEYFDLHINEHEAPIVRRIFMRYVHEGDGCLAIARTLNAEGYTTKRGKLWSQNAISRILRNRIYIGQVVNGKEATKEIYNSKRAKKDETEWVVVDKPELRLIEDDLFDQAQAILEKRNDDFHLSSKKQSNKYLFSTLIKCKHCGRSFRRQKRVYKNTYIYWVCSSKWGDGNKICDNPVKISEDEMLIHIKGYLLQWINDKSAIIQSAKDKFKQLHQDSLNGPNTKIKIEKDIERYNNDLEKWQEMFVNGIIDMDKLKLNIKKINSKITALNKELNLYSADFLEDGKLESILEDIFSNIEDIITSESVTNEMLKKFIDRIEVDRDGNVNVIIKSAESLGLKYNVHFCDNST